MHYAILCCVVQSSRLCSLKKIRRGSFKTSLTKGIESTSFGVYIANLLSYAFDNKYARCDKKHLHPRLSRQRLLGNKRAQTRNHIGTPTTEHLCITFEP